MALPRTIFASLAWLPDGRGLVATGQDLKGALYDQVFLIGHPEPRLQQVTNDFNTYAAVSVSAGEEAIAAVRRTRLANLWLADTTGGPARPITSITNPEDSNIGFAVAGPETVVYTAPRDQSLQVWAIGAGGGEPRPLTSGTTHSFNARAAGGVVVFDREDATGVHIWRMAPDGSGLRQLTSGAGEQVADVSRDGRFAAFAPYDSPRTVSLLSVESGAVSRIPEEASGILGFSPDSGRLLAGVLEADAQGLSRTVWKAFPVAGGSATATFRLPGPALDPTWSPDGRGLTLPEPRRPGLERLPPGRRREGAGAGDPLRGRAAHGPLPGRRTGPGWPSSDGRTRAATYGSPGPTAAAPRRSRSCRRPTSSPCAGSRTAAAWSSRPASSAATSSSSAASASQRTGAPEAAWLSRNATSSASTGAPGSIARARARAARASAQWPCRARMATSRSHAGPFSGSRRTSARCASAARP